MTVDAPTKETIAADAESFTPVSVDQLPKPIGRPSELSEQERTTAASIMGVIGEEYANAARSSAVFPDQAAARVAGRKRVRLMTRALAEKLPTGRTFNQQVLATEGGFTYAIKVGNAQKPRTKKTPDATS